MNVDTTVINQLTEVVNQLNVILGLIVALAGAIAALWHKSQQVNKRIHSELDQITEENDNVSTK